VRAPIEGVDGSTGIDDVARLRIEVFICIIHMSACGANSPCTHPICATRSAQRGPLAAMS
jgi:hypothetical protein